MDRYRFQRRLLGFLLGSLMFVHPAHGELPAPVAQVASALGVDHGNVSLWVQELDRADPLVVHLPDTPRTPASTMKLLTTFVALQGLTPAFHWRTEVHAMGPVVNGVLEGDLLLRGYGDPYLVSEEFWKLTEAIRQRGLRRITGDLVFDTSYYQLPKESPGDFDGQPDRVYNLIPHPLLVNFNAMRFEFEPEDGQVLVTTRPMLSGVDIQNRLRVRPGSCAGYQRGIALNVIEPPLRDQVMLEGAFPAGCERYAMTRSVLQPESYAFGLFEQYWRQTGGEIGGRWRTGVLPSPWFVENRAFTEEADDDADDAQGAASDGTLLHVHHSLPLGALVRLVNKYSNNVMTRQLELTLGAERFGAPATPEKGRMATLELLRQHGVDTAGMIIDNPSGLSRTARLSARQLGEILLAAWQGPYMPEFISSLALSGLDGTVRGRFRDSPARGRMHLKTGTLDHVSAIAGYVQTADNRRFAVVAMVNAPDAHRGPGEEIQNALLNWVFNQPAP